MGLASPAGRLWGDIPQLAWWGGAGFTLGREGREGAPSKGVGGSTAPSHGTQLRFHSRAYIITPCTPAVPAGPGHRQFTSSRCSASALRPQTKKQSKTSTLIYLPAHLQYPQVQAEDPPPVDFQPLAPQARAAPHRSVFSLRTSACVMGRVHVHHVCSVSSESGKQVCSDTVTRVMEIAWGLAEPLIHGVPPHP